MRPAFEKKEEKSANQTTEDPELADRFNLVLGSCVEAMEESGLRYIFIGGIASGGLGRPRSTRDIDIFVMPEDAELALRALAKKGFNTQRTDPSWLYKGFKEGILVDVIFKSKGEIYLDPEMYARSITAEFHGKRLKLVAPEDLLIIKAAAHSEMTPGHWHDATALLSHAILDWPYLLKRARRAPRRVLSLLLYAQSNDIGVPNGVIHELYRSIFQEAMWEASRPQIAHPVNQLQAQGGGPPSKDPAIKGDAVVGIGDYVAAHLREALAEDPRTSELDIEIECSGKRVLLRGEVPATERKEAVEAIIFEKIPDASIVNQIRVSVYSEPHGSEDFK